MEERDRLLAESVLNRLFKESSVNGLRFFTPQLLLDAPIDICQNGYINLTSEWEVFESVPSQYPDNFKEFTQEEEELEIHKLRGQEVEKIEILSPWPHLVVHFKSGKVLYMHGKDEQYEPWTAGLTSYGKDSDTWQVIACPGGDLVVCAPEGWERCENIKQGQQQRKINKTILFSFTILIAVIAPIPKYLLTLSGFGRTYGEFVKQFPPSVYISITLILHYMISFGLAYLLVRKLNLKDRIPHPLAGKKLIWAGGLIVITPSFLHIFTSMIQGGGATFALMSVSAPFVFGGKILLFIGTFILLLAIKPSEKYSYE